MKNVEKTDVLVIGAGMGGLAAAALWAQRGFKVQVLEAHSLPGGCAGFFARKEGFYDVGATTLSGLKPGRPGHRLFNRLKINLKTIQSKPGLVIHYNGKKLRFYTDPDNLAAEFKNHFNYQINSLLNKWQRRETALWGVLEFLESFNWKNPFTYFNIFKIKNLNSLFSISLYFKSLYDYLPKELQTNEEFIKVLDQILLISTQQSSKTCPAFMGLMAFLYPLDTSSIDGGMRSLALTLADKVTEYDGKINYKDPCLKIIKSDGQYLVESKKSLYKSKRIICNIAPIHFDQIFEQPNKFKKETGKIWGALTAYLTIQTQEPITEFFHQVHTTDDSSLFYSYSTREKLIEDNYQYQVTVSTHTNTKDYTLKDEAYLEEKSQFQNLVIDKLKEHLKEKKIEMIHFDSVGTPLTFKHYTSRPRGEVGGLIHHSPFDLLRLVKNKHKSGIYFVGDYSFPGQGIVSVFQSAMNTISPKR